MLAGSMCSALGTGGAPLEVGSLALVGVGTRQIPITCCDLEVFAMVANVCVDSPGATGKLCAVNELGDGWGNDGTAVGLNWLMAPEALAASAGFLS